MSNSIGPYGAERQLAAYPYGEVWEATSADGRFLLLVLTPQLEGAESIAANAVARSADLTGPGIVGWSTHGVADDGRAFLAAPLGDNVSFAQLAKQSGVLNPHNAAGLARDIVQALVSASGAGQFHHSLSDEFVRVEGDEHTGFQAVVYGFGLAELVPGFKPLKKDDPFHGAPAFMSPEQSGGKDPGVNADVYSVGTLMYQAIRGRAPFASTIKGASFATTLKRQVFEKPLALHLRYGKLEHIRDYEKVVLKALEKKSDKRYASVAEFAAGIDALLVEMGDSPSEMSAAPTPQAPVQDTVEVAQAPIAQPQTTGGSDDDLIRFEPPEELVGVSLEKASKDDVPSDNASGGREPAMTLAQGSAAPAPTKRRRRLHSQETLAVKRTAVSSADEEAPPQEASAETSGKGKKKRRFRPEKVTKVDQVAISGQASANPSRSGDIGDDWFMGTDDEISSVEVGDVEPAFGTPTEKPAAYFWIAAVGGAAFVLLVFYALMGGDEEVTEQASPPPARTFSVKKVVSTKTAEPSEVAKADADVVEAPDTAKLAALAVEPDVGTAPSVDLGVAPDTALVAEPVEPIDAGPSPEQLAKERADKIDALLVEAKKNRASGELEDAKILFEEVLEIEEGHAEATRAAKELGVELDRLAKIEEAEREKLAKKAASEQAKEDARLAREARKREKAEAASRAKEDARLKREALSKAREEAEAAKNERIAKKRAEFKAKEAERRRKEKNSAAANAKAAAAKAAAQKAAAAKAASKAAAAKKAEAKAAAKKAAAKKAAAKKAAASASAAKKAAAKKAAAKAAAAKKADAAKKAAAAKKADAAKKAAAKKPAGASDSKAESVKKLKLGMGAYKAGRYKLAAAYFKKSLKLDAANKLARKYLDAAKKKMGSR